MSTAADPLADAFAAARHAPGLVLLEGLHAVKHALRFGAELIAVAAADRAAVRGSRTRSRPTSRSGSTPRRSSARSRRWSTPSRAPASRRSRAARPSRARRRPPPAPVVLLDDPRHLGNVGAVVRVAAAAGAAAVLTTGAADPWAPAALRGSAGLHFALPVGRADPSAAGARPLVAVDPGGPPLGTVALPPSPLLAFGSERARARRGAARARGRARRHPHAPRSLEPEPRDGGGDRALRVDPAAVP